MADFSSPTLLGQKRDVINYYKDGKVVGSVINNLKKKYHAQSKGGVTKATMVLCALYTNAKQYLPQWHLKFLQIAFADTDDEELKAKILLEMSDVRNNIRYE